jgi:hypothetical protein
VQGPLEESGASVATHVLILEPQKQSLENVLEIVLVEHCKPTHNL